MNLEEILNEYSLFNIHIRKFVYNQSSFRLKKKKVFLF